MFFWIYSDAFFFFSDYYHLFSRFLFVCFLLALLVLFFSSWYHDVEHGWRFLYVRELVMPQNVSVEKVSAETQPYKLATYIEKACWGGCNRWRISHDGSMVAWYISRLHEWLILYGTWIRHGIFSWFSFVAWIQPNQTNFWDEFSPENGCLENYILGFGLCSGTMYDHVSFREGTYKKHKRCFVI